MNSLLSIARSIGIMAAFFSVSSAPLFAKSVEAQVTAFLDNYDSVHDNAVGAWPGLSFDTIPKIVVMRNSERRVIGLLAMDHPNPEALGKPRLVTSEESKAVLIETPSNPDVFKSLEHFEFSMPVAGAPTFVISSNCVDPEWVEDCMSSPDYTAYFLHEVFHRFQDDAFVLSLGADQDR